MKEYGSVKSLHEREARMRGGETTRHANGDVTGHRVQSSDKLIKMRLL